MPIHKARLKVSHLSRHLFCKDLFPDNTVTTDIEFSHNIKFFDCVEEAFKADGFCRIQNERLAMLREIKSNPNEHIYYKHTNGTVREFFYDSDMECFLEAHNGEYVFDIKGIHIITEQEMKQILFDIDWNTVEK